MPYYNRDPKRDHNFDNHAYIQSGLRVFAQTADHAHELMVLNLDRSMPKPWRTGPEQVELHGNKEEMDFKKNHCNKSTVACPSFIPTELRWPRSVGSGMLGGSGCFRFRIEGLGSRSSGSRVLGLRLKG